MRLSYVLRHFALAYENVPQGLIGYSDSLQPIVVADAAGSFFQEKEPYPGTPNYRDWVGQRVPFFFDAQPAAPLLTMQRGRVSINADLISAAFYLLSGWQEYFSDERDRHGRFPYAASVQKQYGFVTLPVVNYYFDVLKRAIEHVTGQALKPRRWNGAAFAAFISHDIDELRSAWKAPAKAALLQRSTRRFGALLWQHFTQPDAWDNLESVAAATARYGGCSTFFILPQSRPGADGTPNADYQLSAGLRQRLKALAQKSCEINLHGSIGTATDPLQLDHEARKLQAGCGGLRFHYLRWEPRLTPAKIEAVGGFAYDSTLGFAEHFGFRHSYCQPFYPFNFASGTAYAFVEIPLQVMDATLHHPSYLQLQGPEILPALQPMLAEIERFGGVASILWHNDHFDPANTTTGPQQFAEIMEYLRERGAAFLTGNRIVAEL
ncbi:polysaccharide deacetylase family protein [Hymenobacter glaciei]|uniref:Polysaccharide deacetylase family protein n=2 Tax=Hymenobacter glaciei TaxID=877209 RepID=A0ABP7T5U5_9BACT